MTKCVKSLTLTYSVPSVDCLFAPTLDPSVVNQINST